LEIFLAIPYTHSGVLASALAMDKPSAKRVFARRLACRGRIARREDAAQRGMPYPAPYVIKPPNEGSSVNVRLVFKGDNYDPTRRAPGAGAAKRWSSPISPAARSTSR